MDSPLGSDHRYLPVPEFETEGRGEAVPEREAFECVEKHPSPSDDGGFDQSTLICPVGDTSGVLAVGGSADAANPLSPAKIGRFELRGELGRGAFGIVFRAWDPQLEREVALKVARHAAGDDRDRLLRFLREARAAAQLRHPNIVPIHDAGRDGETYYIAAGLVVGTTLRERCADGPPFTNREIVRLVADIAAALDYAHRSGIVHRDIKPANILVAADGSPQIADFGLARRDQESDTLRTSEGAHVGTPAYMSPEQASGRSREVDAQSDIWSVGVILYELLTGERPFRRESVIELLRAITEDEILAPRTIDGTIPRDLETACLKCLAKRPANRYVSAGELAEDLERWLRGDPIRARRVPLAECTWRWIKRNPASTALMISLAAGVGLSSFFARQWRTQLSAAESANGTIVQQSGELQAQSKQLQSTLTERNEAFDGLKRRLAENDFNQGVALCEMGRIDRGMHHFARALANVTDDGSRLEANIRDNISAWKQQLHVLCWEADAAYSQQSVRFSRDGSRLLTIAANEVHVWDAGTGNPSGKPLRRIQVPLAAEFTADSRTVVTIDPGARAYESPTNRRAASDAQILFWDAATGESRSEPLPCGPALETCALSGDATRAITVTRADPSATAIGKFVAQFWDVEARRPIGDPIDTADAWRVRVGLTPDARLAVVTGLRFFSDHLAVPRVWSLDSGKIMDIPVQHNTAWGVSLFPNASFVLLDDGPFGGVNHSYDVSPLKLDNTSLPYPSGSQARVAAFGPQGRFLATTQDPSGNRVIKIWDLSKTIAQQWVGQPIDGYAVEFSPINSTFATVDGVHLRCWHLPGSAPHALLTPRAGSGRPSADGVIVWTEVATGVEFSDVEGFAPLAAPAWRERKSLLATWSPSQPRPQIPGNSPRREDP